MAKKKLPSEDRSLESRVSAIEVELAQLRGEVRGANGVPRDGWLMAIEKYAGDEDLLSIFAEAQKLREADRKRVRGRRSPIQRAKK